MTFPIGSYVQNKATQTIYRLAPEGIYLERFGFLGDFGMPDIYAEGMLLFSWEEYNHEWLTELTFDLIPVENLPARVQSDTLES